MAKKNPLGYLKSEIYGVICYWTLEMPKSNKRDDVRWKLVESYPIDSSGSWLVKPKNTPGTNSREEWSAWTHKAPEDDDDLDFEPIMSRATTMWTFVAAFNSPPLTRHNG
jgi:hypothetical protein